MNCRPAVASGHPAVTQAACDLLAVGGNAFDAIIGGGFASAVAEPCLTSLGGGGFLMAQPAQGSACLYDFFTDTPGLGRSAAPKSPEFYPITVAFTGSDQIFHIGRASIAVPGNLKGYLEVHSRLGRLPLAEVLAPAVDLSRHGLTLNATQAYIIALLEPIMTATAEGRALYRPDGPLLGAGDHFRNLALTDFLDALSRSEADLYHGSLATRIETDMEGAGYLTARDLQAYRVRRRQPRQTRYGRHQVLTPPEPSIGGGRIALGLQLLRDCPASNAGVAALRRALILKQVHEWRDQGILEPGQLTQAQQRDSTTRLRQALGGTTHISVCDRDGNLAAMTTSNGEGSGYFVPGTGIMLNNMMGEDDLHPEGFHQDPPGQRIASMMTPAVVLRDDTPWLAIGSGGSKRIASAVYQVLENMLELELDLSEAILAGRMHWDGEHLQCEPGLTGDTLTTALPVKSWAQPDIYFGGAHGVTTDGQAAADFRREGDARVL